MRVFAYAMYARRIDTVRTIGKEGGWQAETWEVSEDVEDWWKPVTCRRQVKPVVSAMNANPIWGVLSAFYCVLCCVGYEVCV
jgi:hypothetical protein